MAAQLMQLHTTDPASLVRNLVASSADVRQDSATPDPIANVTDERVRHVVSPLARQRRSHGLPRRRTALYLEKSQVPPQSEIQDLKTQQEAKWMVGPAVTDQVHL